MSAPPPADVAPAGDASAALTMAESPDEARASVSAALESATVGTVIIEMLDKVPGSAAIAYSAVPDTAPGSGLRSFVAILAPTAGAAMEFLTSQPSGAYTLVKEEDDSLAVYVKFYRELRTATVIKAKDWRKSRGTVQWNAHRPHAHGVFAGTVPPVHRMCLQEEGFSRLEHCWDRFLPHVQSLVFEMCCEERLDEESSLGDCVEALASSNAPTMLLLLLPERCGFCLINGFSRQESLAGSFALRQVEFDFSKFCVAVADGTFKPAALLMTTQFSSQRALEPGVTFRSLRDNFQYPDRVKLKETTVSTDPVASHGTHNYIELSSKDIEMELLRAFYAACSELRPVASIALPDALLTTLDSMCEVFASSYQSTQSDADKDRTRHWTETKAQLVSKVLPVWIELMAVAAIASDSTIDSTSSSDNIISSLGQNKAMHPLSRLARAIRITITAVTSQSDDSTTSRVAFLLFRLLALRSHIPTELVALIRDLCDMGPAFRRLFVKAHGPLLLWNATHSVSKPEPERHANSAEPSGRAYSTASDPKPIGLQKPRLASERRSSLFSVARKSLGSKSRSLLFVNAQEGVPMTKFYAFFRLDPHSIESELLKKLTQRHFSEQTLSKLEASSEFCCCHPADTLYHEGCSTCKCVLYTTNDSIGERAAPVKTLVFEVVLQLGKHLLLQEVGSSSWDKDVAMMIRCEQLHELVAEEILYASQQLSESDCKHKLLGCRRSVAIECISVLFELEKKRRRTMATTLGDKKYLLFIAAMQASLRKLNESLANGAAEVNSKYVLDAQAAVFRSIPLELLEEWIMVSLSDIFDSVAALNEAVNICKNVDKTVLVLLIGQLMDIFRIWLERISDIDLQTLLLRLLDRGFRPITPLLHAAITLDTPTNYTVQCQVLGFLNAFAIVDRCLPLRNVWSLADARDRTRATINDDDEEIDQRRSDLLQAFLVFDEKNDVCTWEFLVHLAFSSEASSASSIDEGTSTTPVQALLVLEQSYHPVGHEGNSADPHYFRAVEVALTLQRTLFASITSDYNVEVDVSHAVARHVAGLKDCCRRLDGMASSQMSANLFRIVELHLDCLIALANRRCIIPEIQAALDANSVLSVIVSFLPWSKPHLHDNQLRSAVTPLSEGLVPTTNVDFHTPEQRQSSCEESAIWSGPVPQLRLLLDKRNNDSGSSRSINCGTNSVVPPLKLKSPSSISSIVVRDSKLHALAVVFIVSYILLEPSHELDDTFCSRYAPDVKLDTARETSESQPDLLWQLQRFLESVVQLEMRDFERVLFDMETTQSFVSASRSSAIRNVVRLLSPTKFDRTLYSLPECILTARSSQAEYDSSDKGNVQIVKSPRRDYIAKGGSATVYRLASVVPYPKHIAVKQIDYEHDGDRCIVGSVINEVSILKALRGERAALQLVDFGKNHEENNYEIVTEWCPCTVAEWRSSFIRDAKTPRAQAKGPNSSSQSSTAVPFRALVLMILRCFRKVCGCLARIHARGVCHFDIKSANVFLRVSASNFSHRLLLHGEQHEHEAEVASMIGSVCFGDFGESMMATPEPVSLRSCLSFVSGAPTEGSSESSPANTTKETCSSFLLSRTRGTEAIKSPEVFRIRGNEAAKTKVTSASDIWSIGCLLYELIVQQLLFENDDWPALYAHLLASPEDSAVLRDDHVQSINAALAPSDDSEQRVVNELIEICALILDRQPQRRPTLGSIIRRVCALIHDVLKLPVTTEEKEFTKRMTRSKAQASAVSNAERPNAALAPDTMATPASFCPTQPSCHSRANEIERSVKAAFPRLFWNFFMAGTLPQRPQRRIDTATIDLLVPIKFEAAHAHEFVHFVYFSWLPEGAADAFSSSLSPRQSSSSSVFSRIDEDERRTVFLVHPRLRHMYQTASRLGTSGTGTKLVAQMLQGLVQQAPVVFPVLQRRLRREPGRVVFACVANNDRESGGASTNDLEDVMSSTLLFFLERSVAVSPLDALVMFARDCSPQFLALPRRAFAYQLGAFALQQLQARRRLVGNGVSAVNEHKRRVLVCLCGASVVAIQESALRHALATQRCSCAVSPRNCPSFHPFPSPTASPHCEPRYGQPLQDGDARDDRDGDSLLETEDSSPLVPSTFVHDPWEEQLVLPMEVQARRRTPIVWVVVKREAVVRLESLLAWDAASPSPLPTPDSSSASASASGLKRRASASFDALKRFVTKDSDSLRASPHPTASSGDPLVRGLSPRASQPEACTRSTQRCKWTLLECALCRLPMCAASPERRGELAFPVLSPFRESCSTHPT